MLMVAYLFFLCLVVSIKAVVCAVFRSSTCRSQRLSGWARGLGFLTLQWILIGLQLRSFYKSLLLAWHAVDGSFSSSRSALVMFSSDPHQLAPASNITAKSTYLYLLSVIFAPPHSEQKFLPVFGNLYWSATWRQLHFFDLDRPVVDLSWQVARGVLYIVDCLISFGYSHDHHCFCGPVNETPSHLFFGCALASSLLSWLQSLMFRFSPRCPTLSC